MSVPGLSGRPALLFDLDGTLVDSVYQHVLAWRDALEGEGFHLSVWRVHRRIGMSGGVFLRALVRELGQPHRRAGRGLAAVPRQRFLEADGPGASVDRCSR